MKDKKYLIRLVIFLGLILLGFYLLELTNLFRLYVSDVDQQNLYITIIKIPIYLVIIGLALRYSKKHFNIYNKNSLSLKRLIILYLIALGAIFIIGASLGFKVKPTYDLGNNIVSTNAIPRVLMILMKIIRMNIIVLVISHAHELLSLFFNSKYKDLLPLGGMFSLIFLGLPIFFVDGINLANGFLMAFHLLYGVIYLLTNKQYGKTYLICFIIELF